MASEKEYMFFSLGLVGILLVLAGIFIAINIRKQNKI